MSLVVCYPDPRPFSACITPTFKRHKQQVEADGILIFGSGAGTGSGTATETLARLISIVKLGQNRL